MIFFNFLKFVNIFLIFGDIVAPIPLDINKPLTSTW